MSDVPAGRAPRLMWVRAGLTFAILLAPHNAVGQGTARRDGPPWLVVLGSAQDGGIPQAGSPDHPAWVNTDLRRRVVSLGLVEPATGQRWIFEATPDFREQLHLLDEIAPVDASPGLAGIFLTHAHIGHYTGLIFLGHESLGAREVPVFAMPGMRHFLSNNGPWSQLVGYGNIVLRALEAGTPVPLGDRLSIEGPNRTVLFIPDIDSWEEWDAWGVSIEDEIASVDVAYLDATFFADGELPGRDMSGFPHPLIAHSMERFAALPDAERAKIRFIHLNHSNPAADPDTVVRAEIEAGGFRVAAEGERVTL
ncbi:MAG: MBL fold metallo-hydrolase [Gemmatimonadota bacterium]